MQPREHPQGGPDDPLSRRQRWGWLAPNVLILGAVSLLTDTATEMVIPLLPVFLTSVLGAGALALGWIEGVADGVASILKLVSGRWADRMGRNRPLVIAGYAISSAVRPLVAIAGAAWHVLLVRVTDRTGKGLRTSPRDALIAASVEPRSRGAAFGLHRAMDHAGAVLGPLIAVAFIGLVSKDLRVLFALTAIPGALAVLVLVAGVKEAATDGASSVGAISSVEPSATPSSRALARVLVPLGLFALGNASDTFLLLKAGAVRASLVTLPLLWMGLHIVKTVVSIPGGHLADRFGRRRIIGLGWLVYVAVYTGFAFAESREAVWVLFVVYGVYHGLTEGAEKALVAGVSGVGRRGTAFGWFHVTQGLLTLAASVLFGALWEGFGNRVAFLTSGGIALLALLALFLLAPRRDATERLD